MAKKTPTAEDQPVPQGADSNPTPLARRPSSLVDIAPSRLRSAPSGLKKTTKPREKK